MTMHLLTGHMLDKLLYVGHHYTKISQNWIENCRRSSISRDPSEQESLANA